MTEGRSPILFAWAALAGLAAAAGGTAVLVSGAATSSVLAVAAATAMVFSVLLLPMVVALDRFISAWHGQADEIARGALDPTLRAPRGLRTIVGPIHRALEALHRRERDTAAAHDETSTRFALEREAGRIAGTALDHVRDGVIVTGPDDRIRLVNRAAAELLGTDREATVHRSLAAVAGPRLADVVARLTADGSIDQTIGFKAGETECLCDVTVTGMVDAHDELVAKVTLIREPAATGATSDPSAEFVSHVTHELRTPLTSIRAYAEMLLDGHFRDDDARKGCYETILEEADRLARLIGNMLELSRLEAGRIEVDHQAVDMGPLVTRAARILGLQAAAKGIALETSLPAHPLVAQGDADLLYQVVLNLASNAVKYTRTGGRILVSAHADALSRHIVVSVADSGLGIPANDVPHLFDKFYRIKSHRRAAEGTGIGLSLCKHIVETVHGGRIDVRSTIGVGSRFSFTIPAWVSGLRQHREAA